MKTNVWCYAGQRRATIIGKFPDAPKGVHQRLTEFLVVDCEEKDCPFREGKNSKNNGECLIKQKIENPWL